MEVRHGRQPRTIIHSRNTRRNRLEEVWRDPEEAQPAVIGILSIVGPTLRGELIVGSNDQPEQYVWSEFRGSFLY